MHRKLRFYGLLSLVLISMLAITSVASGVFDPWLSSADPSGEGEVPPGNPDTIIGDQPDEPGYEGDPITAGDGEAASSADEWAVQLDGPGMTVPAGAPDSDEYTGEPFVIDLDPSAPSTAAGIVDPFEIVQPGEPQLDAPDATNAYHFVTGSALRPRDSRTGYDISSSGGCIHVTNNAEEVLNVDIQLPQGSIFLYLRIFYYDTSASNSTAWVTRYDGAGGYTDLTSVSSSGSAGYGQNVSAAMSGTVDNLSYTYVFNWRPHVADSTMELCGLRLNYTAP